jgi:hypothetical protein
VVCRIHRANVVQLRPIHKEGRVCNSAEQIDASECRRLGTDPEEAAGANPEAETGGRPPRRSGHVLGVRCEIALAVQVRCADEGDHAPSRRGMTPGHTGIAFVTR